MPTRTVELTDRYQQMIEALVKSGRYGSADAVLQHGLRLVEEREARQAAKLEALREAAHIGMAAFDEGRFKEFESADALADYLDELSKRVLSAPAK